MCGIFGSVALSARFGPKDYEQFAAATTLAKHRGPDAEGSVALSKSGRTDVTPESFDVFLGHRRLSIIDLSEAGVQPMTDGRGRWITYNGEIYNYIELRETLKKEGYVFRTATDTEVILAVYERWGPEGFRHLNGDWAFALFDAEKSRLLLSRDRFSVKPLYYLRNARGWFFSSELKQLLPFLAHTNVNNEILRMYLQQGLLDATEYTFIEGIKQVLPRHNLIISLQDGSSRQEAYWDYSKKVFSGSFDTARDEFRALLDSSVQLRLRSDVNVGTLLSGGLDSSTIAVLANNTQPEGVESFSVVPPNRADGEEAFIDLLVDATHVRNRKVRFDVDNLLGAIDEVLYHNDEPPAGFSAVAHYCMMRKVREEGNVTVLLSGQGSDELLLGYRKFFFFAVWQMMREGKFARAAAECALSAWHGTTMSQLHLGEAQRYLPRSVRAKRRYLKHSAYEESLAFTQSDLRDRQIADIERYSVPNLTHYEDRNAMAFGLEIRLPFLDHRLVDFAIELPVDYKQRGGWNKYILRQSMPELPQGIRYRRDKQGFLLPEKKWLGEDLVCQITELFSDGNSILEQLGLIDATAFLERYNAFRRGGTVTWHTDFSRALFAELWARRTLKTSNERLSQAS